MIPVILALYLISSVFAAYIITVVLVRGHLFTYFRCRLRVRTLWLIKGPPGDRWHLIDCRVCTGAWVSAAITAVAIVCCGVVCWITGMGLVAFCLCTIVLLAAVPIIFGASYFLATQER